MQQLDITMQQLETATLVDAGAVPTTNLLSIQAQVATEEFQKTSTKANLEMAHLQLTQLMDFPDYHNFDIKTPDIDIEIVGSPLTSEYIYNIAVENMPEIKSAEMKFESSKKSVSIAKSGLSPNISIGQTIGSGYSGASRELTNYEFEDMILLV